jgi:hypothetical protein
MTRRKPGFCVVYETKTQRRIAYLTGKKRGMSENSAKGRKAAAVFRLWNGNSQAPAHIKTVKLY